MHPAVLLIHWADQASDKLGWFVRGTGGALMAEGLNPIEAGKKLHEHGEAHERQTEGADGHGESDDRHSRIVQICEALVLALVTIAAGRFRPQFRVAFNASMATNPLHNPNAPPGPTYMPQYKQPAQAQANALDSAADAKFNAGNEAGLVGDNYVRITVFLAAVLFLVGIGSSFKLHSVRYALITFGSVLLILSVVLILRQPGLPS